MSDATDGPGDQHAAVSRLASRRPAGVGAGEVLVEPADGSEAADGSEPADGSEVADGSEAASRSGHEGQAGSAGDAAEEEGPSTLGRLLAELRRPESVVTLVVVAACALFVFFELQPSQLFRDTTPAGGDMGAHVWLPAYFKRVLLPHFRLLGWSMDWYAGFPAMSFYFPLPVVAIALASYVIPYDIAFKLVTASGIVLLPVAAWAFGRLARMRFPGPACLAVGSVAFLFGREFTIYGGNIASAMAGEFSFSVSLAFALVFLGLSARVLRTGRSRALAAVVLAACGLSHVLPLFFAGVGAVVQLLQAFSVARLRRIAAVLVVAALLIAFWALPYEVRLPYATNMGYGKITTYLAALFPPKELWLFVLAGVGAVLSLARRNRTGAFLLIMAVLAAVAFRIGPNARLWNARWLPFWFLCLYLLAAVAFAEVGALVAEAVRSRAATRARLAPLEWRLIPVPVVTLVVALVWVGFPLRILPFGHVDAAGDYDWLGITSSDSSYIPDWVHWNYSGYQAVDKSSRATYFALMAEMRRIGAADGCGRAMYEYEPAINDMGTPDALMLLPYWTHGCIASMEGLYYESSATTPYHFINASELSEQPSDPMRGLQYASAPDVALGVQHLQMFGVRYFMAVSPQVKAQAAADPSLKLLAAVGPYPTDVTGANNKTTVQDQTWDIYEVLGSPLVQPLANQPVVMKGVNAGSDEPWLLASEKWYLDPSRWDVYETASGPASWARVPAGDRFPPIKPEPSTSVTHVREGEESVSFDVSRPGVPVLVKVSYFPNWHVRGAAGVYRATPNEMVVVPDARHVTLTYGHTFVDWAGLVLTLVGLGGVAALWRGEASLRRRRRRRPLREMRPLRRRYSWAGGEGHEGFWDRPDPWAEDPWYQDEVPVGAAGRETVPKAVGGEWLPPKGSGSRRRFFVPGRPSFQIPPAPPPDEEPPARG